MGVLDNCIEAVRYYFRTAQFEYIRNIKSSTIIIFVHGILSHSKEAFKLSNGNGFFWDILKDQPIFNNFDIAIFSYGKIDLSYALEGTFPLNNLFRVSYELNGYVESYRNVLFVAHSQGGLLAKTYATLFHKTQGIHLLTLHTPHRNKSLAVMRFDGNDLWEKEACYQVPHIFCASICDTKIVKPDNAFATSHDRKYLSTDKSKKHLGHSHLSSNPEEELLILYYKDILYFTYSGLSRVFCNTAQQNIGKYQSNSLIEIQYSRLDSFKKQDQETRYEKIINRPWVELIKQGPEIQNLIRNNTNDSGCVILIQSIGCSISFFAKYLKLHFSDIACIHINNIDSKGESNSIASEFIFEWTFE